MAPPWLNSVHFLIILCILSQLHALNETIYDQNDKLIFAHILFRHGEKNLIHTYPNDPWKDESNWPGGFGELTNIGKQQQYQLGTYLRQRYTSLLMSDGSYNRNNIYIMSSDVDRSLMSASYMSAAMFPPINEQVWNDSLLWQAIPIHTLPVQMDHILYMKRPCPMYDESYEAYQQSPEIQLILKNNESLIKYLERHSGKKILQLCDVRTIYYSLMTEKSRGFSLVYFIEAFGISTVVLEENDLEINFSLPDWTRNVFVPGGDMEKIARFCGAMPTNTKLLARLKAGFLIREILERFAIKKNGTLMPDRSLWIYSANDATIGNALNALGLFEPHIPSFASCLFFELHKFNGTFHVEIYYKRDHRPDKVPLEPMFIPNCGQKCPLNKIYEVYHDILPTKDFDIECRLPKTDTIPIN